MHVKKFFAAAAVAAAAVAPAIVLMSAAPAGATTVTTEAELRTAFGDAGETSITLANDITLTDCVAGRLFRASGAALTLDGGGFTIEQTCTNERVLEAHSDLTINDATITGGNLTDDDGGGIFSVGALTLHGVHVTGNRAVNSGGIASDSGALTITDSVIDDNHADDTGGEAGGIGIGQGVTTIVDSTIANNSATYAGGFFRYGGGPDTDTVTLIGTTVSGNTAVEGAAGFDSLKDVTLVNTTVTGNSTPAVDGSGGATTTETMTLVYSTIVGNSGGDGANVASATNLVSFGSVVANPLGGGENCVVQDTATSDGYNFSDDTSCGFTDATDVQGPANDPRLGALASNGGPTRTMLPQAGSPLLDKIPAASCQASIAAGISTDQRGVTRPQGTGCDIGAVEVEVVVPSPAAVNPRFTG